MLPTHVEQTLADLDALIADLTKTAQTLRVVYTVEPIAAIDAPAPAVPPAPKARRAAKAVAQLQGARAGKAMAKGSAGSKYDEGILRFLKSEAAQHGASLSDVIRHFTGPGKPTEVQRLSGAIYAALVSLQTRGLTRKDGRYWHVVREREQAVAP